MGSAKPSPPLAKHQQQHYLAIALHLVSFALLYLPQGLSWYFGNLVVYLNSYYYVEHNATTFSSNWLISTYIMVSSVSFIGAGNALKRIDQRIFTFLGVLLFNAGAFLTYLSVQHSQPSFILTYGVITGVGFGFTQMELFTRISQLFPKRTALAFAFLNSFSNIGAVFFDWVITSYANPFNVKAETLVLGHYKIFNDKYVIDHVPSVFLVLGAMSSICHLCGLTLTLVLKDRAKIQPLAQQGSETSSHDGIPETPEESSLIISQNEERVNVNYGDELKTDVNTSSAAKKAKIVLKYNTASSSNEENPNNIGDDINEKRTENQERTENNAPPLLSPDCAADVNQYQMVKTLSFYLLWFNFFANDSACTALLNYYKVFGELWISDDHFLTHLGMAALCAVVVIRIVLALSMDWFGIKTTQIFHIVSMVLTFLWYCFTPRVSRWLFAAWTCVAMALCSSTYLIFPVMILKLYGRAHFASNYGLLSTSTIVLNLAAPQLFQTAVHRLGWTAVFIGIGTLNAVAMMVIMPGLPSQPTRFDLT